jgi:large subunit ribosomal protein L28
MSRQCEITGKKPQVGHKVSHANNKTKRRFLPNLQEASFFSTGLKRNIKVTASTHGIRTVEHKGGIDAFLLGTAPTKLMPGLRKARKQLVAVTGELPKPEPKKRYAASTKKADKKATKKAAKKAA